MGDSIDTDNRGFLNRLDEWDGPMCRLTGCLLQFLLLFGLLSLAIGVVAGFDSLCRVSPLLLSFLLSIVSGFAGCGAIFNLLHAVRAFKAKRCMEAVWRSLLGALLFGFTAFACFYCLNAPAWAPWCNETGLLDAIKFLCVFSVLLFCVGTAIAWLAGCFDEEEVEDGR